MNFKELANVFHEHADELFRSTDANAKFRARSYKRTGDIFEQKFDSSEQVTESKLSKLGLTDFMKDKALAVSKGENIHTSKTKKQIKKKEEHNKINSKRNVSRTSSQLASRTSNVLSNSVRNDLSNTKRNDLSNAKKSVRKSRSRTREEDEESESGSESGSDEENKNVKSKLSKEAKIKLIEELTELMGIGEERAKELVNDGLQHLNQLHMKKWLEKLPIETQTFLKLKPTTPIKHEEIAALEPLLLALQDKNFKLQIVGSYRRNTKTSNDIDVMLVTDLEDGIHKFFEKISKSYKVYPYSKGSDKMSFIIDLRKEKGFKFTTKSESMDSKSKKVHQDNNEAVYKLDVFRVEKDNFVPMLLYSTGSKEHNIKMRGKAKALNMLLNQKGLFKKENDGSMFKITDLNSEEDYFKALNMEYKNPEDRF